MKRAPLLLLLLLGACPRGATGYLEPPADGAEVLDPVSGDHCFKTPTTEAAVYQNKTYYFCGPNRATFAADPAAYVR